MKQRNKGIILISLLFAPMSWAVSHQDNQSVEIVPQNKIQQCVKLLDQTALQEAEQRGIHLNGEIDMLCRSDQRNKAQNKAIGFAREIQKSQDLLGFRLCNRSAVEPLNRMQKLMKYYFISDLRFTHICDQNK